VVGGATDLESYGIYNDETLSGGAEGDQNNRDMRNVLSF
jgi:hypothetical protein